MNKTSISKIAIFLNQSQLELLGKKSIDQTILDLFFNKLEALFPQVEILSNYNFNLQKISNTSIKHRSLVFYLRLMIYCLHQIQKTQTLTKFVLLIF